MGIFQAWSILIPRSFSDFRPSVTVFTGSITEESKISCGEREVVSKLSRAAMAARGCTHSGPAKTQKAQDAAPFFADRNPSWRRSTSFWGKQVLEQ